MPNERSNQPPPKDKASLPKDAKPEKPGRTGEGSRSVIPHLRADLRARATAKIAKRMDRDF